MNYSPFLKGKDEYKSINEINYADLIVLKDFEEGYTIEYKSQFDKNVQKKLPQIIASFANCGGGWLFIGIDDITHNCIDVEKPNGEIETTIYNLLSRFVTPRPIQVSAKFIENPNNLNHGIIVIYVEEGINPPYEANGTIYVREGSSKVPILSTRSTIDYLYRKKDYSSVFSIKCVINNKEANIGKIKQLNLSDSLNASLINLTSKIDNSLKKLETITFDSQQKPINNIFWGYETTNDPHEFFKEQFSTVELYCKQKYDWNLVKDVGTLRISNIILQGWNYHGEEKASQKCDEIINLSKLINEHNALAQLVAQLTNKKFIRLLISNDGIKYDEDITVKLFFEKNSFYDIKKITLNGYADKYNELIIKILGSNETSNIKPYNNYPKLSNFITPPMKFELSNTFHDYNDLNYLVELKQAEIEENYCFELFKDNNTYDIVKIVFQKVSPNEKIFFPSIIILNKELTNLQYEINTKHSSLTIKGNLAIE